MSLITKNILPVSDWMVWTAPLVFYFLGIILDLLLQIEKQKLYIISQGGDPGALILSRDWYANIEFTSVFLLVMAFAVAFLIFVRSLMLMMYHQARGNESEQSRYTITLLAMSVNAGLMIGLSFLYYQVILVLFFAVPQGVLV